MRLTLLTLCGCLLPLLGLWVAPARADEPATVEHDGYRGFWLRSPTVEAFVALAPKFRILSLRLIGEKSLLADSGVYEQGVRLAFMEDQQIPASFRVGNVPAEVVERAASSATLRLQAADGLQYTATLQLSEDRPALEMQTSLKNVGDAPRRVGCWTVLAFARDGTIVVPFGNQTRMRRRLALSWWTQWPQPSVSFGIDALTADAGGALAGTAFKVGVICEPGWIALARGGRALLIGVPFDPDAVYPEDGANVTLFMEDDATGNWSEIEQVGPLVSLQPGESTRMTQTLDLLKPVPPADASPDAWRHALEEALKRQTHSEAQPKGQ